jgi:hypothetical protein
MDRDWVNLVWLQQVSDLPLGNGSAMLVFDPDTSRVTG